MSYEQVFREYNTATAFTPTLPLEVQPRYAVLASIVALLCISGAFALASSKKNMVIKFLEYLILSVFGSLFFGIAAVLSSNSFGVYV
ncbi:hypothetical protein NCAS_0E00400 [Naumovozyma castellii]|uniref:Dolichyl-diphosphooligosaccharide-protein glycosyltransferase subunit OST5 n=1 Tax=Naumovozyma castellii TaxID=27288 RepID=G0VF45_NAUCA|nr:hypothetical protein NCAS_0E00400 [Naumovozyma castellii CBS 4309]CCC70110.1 hypothetical protein NCAS_0E00400 [Naumovozyma castellii CBS 4309]